MSDTCGFTIYDTNDEEQPCDRPATGWRWYQGHDHEDALDVACELHENEGGRRIHEAESALAKVYALAERWRFESNRLGPDDTVLTSGVASMLLTVLPTSVKHLDTKLGMP